MPLASLENGRYQSIKELGSGSMGEVYLVNDTVIGRKVAIKVMRTDPSVYTDTATTQDAVRLFKHEAQAIARLEHPHILPLYDFGEEKQQHTLLLYMVMPNCPQGSLATWLQQRYPTAPLPPDSVAYFIEQAAEALQYAHNHQIIHQDVKPSNFLLRTVAEQQTLPDLLLADFGVARMSSGTTVSLLNAGPCGTPRYMPPEQWEGKPVPASDQYALAVMAYQLLTTTFPFQGTQMLQLMYQHLQVAPEPPSRANPRLSPAIDAVIGRALAKKPEERFSSVKAFAVAFRQAIPSAQPVQSLRSSGYPSPITPLVPTEEYDTSTPTLGVDDFPPAPRQAPVILPATSTFSYPSTPPLAGQSVPTPAFSGTMPAPPQRALAGAGQVQAPLPAMNSTLYAPSGKPAQPRRRASRGKTFLLVGLALLIVLAGAGTWYALTLAHANDNPYASSMSALRYSDPLGQPQMWQNLTYNQRTNGFCLFQQDAYHVSTNVTGTFTLCPTTQQQPTTGDMTFEVQMQILHGDCGGIVFRADFQQGNFYYFDVCFDGRHYFVTYAHNALLTQFPMQSTPFAALQSNPQTSVTVAIVARGSLLSFYLDHQQIDQLTDATYTSGQISLFSFSINRPTEVVFSNARLWTA